MLVAKEVNKICEMEVTQIYNGHPKIITIKTISQCELFQLF